MMIASINYNKTSNVINTYGHYNPIDGHNHVMDKEAVEHRSKPVKCG